MLRAALSLFAVFVAPAAVFAHGMDMDIKVKGGTVSVALFYDDDSPGAGAKVKVLNAAKEVILEGTTDAAGAWSFPAPPPGEYTIRAKTADGHAAKGEFTVPADPPPADAPPVPEPERARPPRLLLLGVGLLVLTVGFNVWYWLGRRKRPPVAANE